MLKFKTLTLGVLLLLIGEIYAQFSQPGELDTTFNFGRPHSFFTNPTNPQPGEGADGSISTTVLQPDGKVLIGGDFTVYNGTARNRIARLNADGSLDASFNPGLGVSASFGFPSVLSLALQPDGKVLIGGFFTSYNGTSRNRIARLNSNGSLDATFNPGTGVGGSSPFVSDLTLQPDGKVFIVGDFTSYNGTSRNRIARLNANGSLDATFNPGTGANSWVYSLAFQPDGKVLIGGVFSSYNGTVRNRIARLNADGSLDTTFNPGAGASSNVLSLALLPNGKVLIGGDFTSYNGTSLNGIARLNADGSLDSTFNPGTGVGGSTQIVNSLALQSDGKVLIGGRFSSYNGTPRNNIALLNANGGLDTTFNPGNGGNNGLNSLALQPSDGKVLIGGGFISYNFTSRSGIARLNADGSMDTTFNMGTGANISVRSFALQPNGKVLIGGRFTNYNRTSRNRIARLNVDGSLDTTFNPGLGANIEILAILLQPDGKVLIGGGFTTYNGTSRNRIARLNADGSLDLTFNPDTGANNEVSSLALQPDGKILIGGGFTSYNGTSRNYITRLNSDGSLDATFNPGIGANSNVRSFALQPDGKILIGGGFTSYNGTSRNYIARLNADGSLDTTFNPGSGTTSFISSIALQPDGKILIVGNFFSYNGTSRNSIARLNSNGSLDASFNPGTGVGGSTRIVNSLTLQSDGKVLIGGTFTSYNGTSCNDIARLNANGSLDATFNPGIGVGGGPLPMIMSLALQPDGKVLIGGEFTSYRGIFRNRIARLFSPNCITPTNTTDTSALCIGSIKALTGTFGGSWIIASGPGLITGTIYTSTASGTVSVYNEVGGCNSPLVTFTVNPLPSAPTVSAPAAICAGNTASISPTSGGVNYRFYANSTGGIPLTGGNSVANYTTPILSNSTTYHVASVSAQGCESSTRTPVTVTVNPLPSIPTASNINRCGPGTAIINPTAGGVNYRFYATSTGGSPLAGGNGVTSFTTSALTNTTTFYVSSISAAGCESNSRRAVTVFVNSIPSAPTFAAAPAICQGSTATLVPSAGGVIYRFYADSSGGSPLFGGNGVLSFTTPTLNTSTTYHVASVSAQGCESNTRTAVMVTVNPTPSTPTIATPSSICSGESTTIVPSAGGVNYRFYSNSSGGSPLAGGNGVASYTTPILTNTTIYHVASLSAQGCESVTRTPVTVAVNALPASPTVPVPSEICAGTNANIVPTAGGSTYRFYSSATGGSPLIGGNGVTNYITPILSSNTTYHVSSVSAQGCESSTRTAVTVIVNLLPNVVVTLSNDTLTASIIFGTYQWLFNGVIIPGANSNIFVPTQSGNYSAQVTSPQGCVGVSAPVVVIVSGIENGIQKQKLVDIFPNPLQDQLHIDSEIDFTFELTDVLGNVLLRGQKTAGDNLIFIDHLSSGTYFMKVINVQNTFIKKLIKQ